MSIAEQLIQVAKVPAAIFQPIADLSVKIKLLDDGEDEKCARAIQMLNPIAAVIVGRRVRLALCILWIENQNLEMSDKMKETWKDENNGVDPTEFEQKYYVLSKCDPILLQEIDKGYGELLDSQKQLFETLKKKSTSDSDVIPKT